MESGVFTGDWVAGASTTSTPRWCIHATTSPFRGAGCWSWLGLSTTIAPGSENGALSTPTNNECCFKAAWIFGNRPTTSIQTCNQCAPSNWRPSPDWSPSVGSPSVGSPSTCTTSGSDHKAPSDIRVPADVWAQACTARVVVWWCSITAFSDWRTGEFWTANTARTDG